jgi:hypothetical protein
VGHGGPVAFAGADQDRFTRSGHQRSRIELDCQLPGNHEEELVAVLVMPFSVEPPACGTIPV